MSYFIPPPKKPLVSTKATAVRSPLPFDEDSGQILDSSAFLHARARGAQQDSDLLRKSRRTSASTEASMPNLGFGKPPSHRIRNSAHPLSNVRPPVEDQDFSKGSAFNLNNRRNKSRNDFEKDIGNHQEIERPISVSLSQLGRTADRANLSHRKKFGNDYDDKLLKSRLRVKSNFSNTQISRRSQGDDTLPRLRKTGHRNRSIANNLVSKSSGNPEFDSVFIKKGVGIASNRSVSSIPSSTGIGRVRSVEVDIDSVVEQESLGEPFVDSSPFDKHIVGNVKDDPVEKLVHTLNELFKFRQLEFDAGRLCCEYKNYNVLFKAALTACNDSLMFFVERAKKKNRDNIEIPELSELFVLNDDDPDPCALCLSPLAISMVDFYFYLRAADVTSGFSERGPGEEITSFTRKSIFWRPDIALLYEYTTDFIKLFEPLIAYIPRFDLLLAVSRNFYGFTIGRAESCFGEICTLDERNKCVNIHDDASLRYFFTPNYRIDSYRRSFVPRLGLLIGLTKLAACAVTSKMPLYVGWPPGKVAAPNGPAAGKLGFFDENVAKFKSAVNSWAPSFFLKPAPKNTDGHQNLQVGPAHIAATEIRKYMPDQLRNDLIGLQVINSICGAAAFIIECLDALRGYELRSSTRTSRNLFLELRPLVSPAIEAMINLLQRLTDDESFVGIDEEEIHSYEKSFKAFRIVLQIPVDQVTSTKRRRYVSEVIRLLARFTALPSVRLVNLVRDAGVFDVLDIFLCDTNPSVRLQTLLIVSNLLAIKYENSYELYENGVILRLTKILLEVPGEEVVKCSQSTDDAVLHLKQKTFAVSGMGSFLRQADYSFISKIVFDREEILEELFYWGHLKINVDFILGPSPIEQAMLTLKGLSIDLLNLCVSQGTEDHIQRMLEYNIVKVLMDHWLLLKSKTLNKYSDSSNLDTADAYKLLSTLQTLLIRSQRIGSVDNSNFAAYMMQSQGYWFVLGQNISILGEVDSDAEASLISGIMEFNER